MLFTLNPYNTDRLIADAYFSCKDKAVLVRKNEPVFLETSSFVVVADYHELFSEQIPQIDQLLLDVIKYYDGRYESELSEKYYGRHVLMFTQKKNNLSEVENHYNEIKKAVHILYGDRYILPEAHTSFIALIKEKIKNLKITRLNTGEKYFSGVSHTMLPSIMIYVEGRKEVISFEGQFIARLFALTQKVPTVVSHNKGYSMAGVNSDYQAAMVSDCIINYKLE